VEHGINTYLGCDYQGVADAASGLGRYWKFYNDERLHQSLAYKTPAAVYVGH
jgi:putative transposase